jgi:hypothetical protein
MRRALPDEYVLLRASILALDRTVTFQSVQPHVCFWGRKRTWPPPEVPLGRRAMRAGQSREQRLGETGNGTTVDLVHRLRLGRVWRGSPAVIADAQHRAL